VIGYPSLFQAIASSPTDWFLDAARLKQAANVIFEAITAAKSTPNPPTLWDGEGEPLKDRDDWLTPVFMFLAGCAIENLVKATLVGRDATLISEAKLAKTLTTHELPTLLELVNITPTPAQASLAGRLTKWIIWAGRYPTPVNSSNTTPDSLHKLGLFEETDPPEIDGLFALLQALFVQEWQLREHARWQAAYGTAAPLDV